MNKQELIAAVAARKDVLKHELTNGAVGVAIDAIIDTITSELKKGGEVRLVPFGTFEVRKRKATTGRNPRTGEQIEIAASKMPRFRAGKGLKEAVN